MPHLTLTIYIHENGSFPVFLPGARFRIRYADPNVSALVWTLTTGADGMIHIDLPHAGKAVYATNGLE